MKEKRRRKRFLKKQKQNKGRINRNENKRTICFYNGKKKKNVTISKND